jgi:predicted dehydrogenase
VTASSALRIAVIGCGRHAAQSIHPQLTAADLQPVAVCAAHLDRAARTAQPWPGASAYDDVRALLDRETIEAAVVCLPPDQYRPVVSALLAAGVPVWAEKPAATSSAELTALADDAAAHGAPLLVGYMKRYAPAYTHARELCYGPEFGQVSSLHVRWTLGPGFADPAEWVIDNLVHPLDLLRWFGGEVTDVAAKSLVRAPGRQALALALAHESGAVSTAQLATTASWSGPAERLEVLGDGEAVTVSNVDTVDHMRSDGAVTRRRPSYTVPLATNTTPVTTGFRPELEHFHDVVLNGTPPRTPATDAARTLALAERVRALLRE